MTALSNERLASLLAYCRVSPDVAEDVEVISAAYPAAVAYMDGAGVEEPSVTSPFKAQYDLCVNYLVLDAFDRRARTVTGPAAENPAFRQSLNQLKLISGISAAEVE